MALVKTAIVTDSNSGITQAQAKELGIRVIPMPFMIDGKEYFEDINLSQEEFYEMLLQDKDVSTSQPSPEAVLNTWDEVLKDYESLVYIPMSSGLSGSFQTAHMLADDYDGKVEVVNNQRISVTMRQSVLDAIKLAEEGKSAAEIRTILEDNKFESSIYIMVDTLNYLKKGGRLTPAVATLGQLLKIKPVLQIQGEKLDAFSLARTANQAKVQMLTQMVKDVTNRFHAPESGKGMHLMVAHTQNEAAANTFLEEIKAKFPEADFYVDKLSLSVSCHIGPGALAIACAKEM